MPRPRDANECSSVLKQRSQLAVNWPTASDGKPPEVVSASHGPISPPDLALMPRGRTSLARKKGRQAVSRPSEAVKDSAKLIILAH
jgi:hypothetical protein